MTDTKKCPKCGRHLHSDAQYCMYCMHSLQPKKDVTPKDPPNSGKLIFMLVCIVLAIALIAVGIVTHFKQNGNDEPSVSTADKQPQLSGQEMTPDNENDQLALPGTLDAPAKPAGSDIPESTAPHTAKTDIKTDPSPSEPADPEPTQTEPEPEPTQAEPEPTDPVATNPGASQPQCSHYYMEATCNEPMTCVYCADTWGSVDADAHNWVADTVTVHHKEVGHYEEEEDYVEKTKYLCFFCGYSQEGYDSVDEVREHISVHSHYSTYELIVHNLEANTDTREVWEKVTVQKWVVDEEAYDETVITGYTCSLCNAKKGV